MYCPLTVPINRVGLKANTPKSQLPVAPQTNGTKYSGLPSLFRSKAKARSGALSTAPSLFWATFTIRLSFAFGYTEGAAQFQSNLTRGFPLISRQSLF